MWQSGEEAAFEAIYKKYFIRLVNIAWQKTGSRQNAEELAQDAFVAVYLQRDNLQKENLDGYLFITLRNKIYNYTRQKLVRAKYEASLNGEQEEVSADATGYVETKELEGSLRKQIDKLPAQCREAFILSRFENMSYKEIASNMGISVNTVEKHIGKALRLLRAELGEKELCLVAVLLSAIAYV